VLNEQRGREHFRGPPAPLRFTGQQLLRLAQLEDVAHPADAIDLGGYGADRCAGGSRRQEAELDTVGLMAARLQDLGVQAGDSSLPHLLQQSLNAGVERVGGYLTGGYGAVVQQVPTDLSGDGGRTVHRGLGAELAASDDMMGTVAPGVLHEVGQISLQDIDDMSGAVTEIARILADDCPLVLAIVHPMYSGGKFAKSKFSVTFRNSNLFIIKRSYFQSKRLVSTDMYGSLRVTLFREHRPLQVYTQALIDAGFNIEKLIELTDDDQARNRGGIPVFLDILARRQPRAKQAADSAQDFLSEIDIDAKLQSIDRNPGGAEIYSPVIYSPVQPQGRTPLPVGRAGHRAGKRSIMLVFSLTGLAGLIATALLAGIHP
jgi:hypothetical protein